MTIMPQIVLAERISASFPDHATIPDLFPDLNRCIQLIVRFFLFPSDGFFFFFFSPHADPVLGSSLLHLYSMNCSEIQPGQAWEIKGPVHSSLINDTGTSAHHPN